MPEGPSMVILKDEVKAFTGKKVLAATGNAKEVNFKAITGQKIVAFKTYGKHFLICFPKFTIRIHFLLFGTYAINDVRNAQPRLSLKFARGQQLNFYTCAVKTIVEPLDEVYDWRKDVMHKKFDEAAAVEAMVKKPKRMVCDVLLDQDIFAGVGNIIKNEVLFRKKVNPKSTIGKIPLAKRKALAADAVKYSFEFLKWKKQGVLAAHWKAHKQTTCPRDGHKMTKAYPGQTKRRAYFCTLCQQLYT